MRSTSMTRAEFLLSLSLLSTIIVHPIVPRPFSLPCLGLPPRRVLSSRGGIFSKPDRYSTRDGLPLPHAACDGGTRAGRALTAEGCLALRSGKQGSSRPAVASVTRLCSFHGPWPSILLISPQMVIRPHVCVPSPSPFVTNAAGALAGNARARAAEYESGRQATRRRWGIGIRPLGLAPPGTAVGTTRS
jgi:hypothetical protein